MIRVRRRAYHDEGLSLEQIGRALHWPTERVRQLEHDGLTKIAIGLALVDLLGRVRGELVLVSLRHRKLPDWRNALIEARRVALGGSR